ncbi:MAG: hypothetical protein JJT88_11115 [Gammaproteobacteria bacterium]|nr:hypothetical protein [Gammaproteobacteria bacterium]
MARHDKYVHVVERYGAALTELASVLPAAQIETWMFAARAACYGELAPVAAAKVPSLVEYSAYLTGGSAIADCLFEVTRRAVALNVEQGVLPTRIVLWTDGWDRASEHAPDDYLEAVQGAPDIAIHLIAFVDRSERWRLDDFVREARMEPDQVSIFEHGEDQASTLDATYAAADAFNRTIAGLSEP